MGFLFDYLFLSVKLYANLFLHLKSLSCGQFSLTYSNVSENSVHMTSHDYIESESSYSWHYFRFQSTYRDFFHLTFMSCGKHLPSILLNRMRECPSQVSNQKRYDFFLSRFERKRLPVSIFFFFSAPFTKDLVFIKQYQASSHCLVQPVGETEGDRFPTPASNGNRPLKLLHFFLSSSVRY